MQRLFPAFSLALALLVGVASRAADDAAPAASATPPPPPPPASAAPATAAPKAYAIDAKRSTFVIQVFKDGAAAALAHDHTVHATDIIGELTVDPAAPERAKLKVSVSTKSLVNDDPTIRKQFGLDPNVPEKDRAAVNESMRGADQLDVAKFPTITFASSAVEKSGEKLTLVGDFTLKGVTKKMKMPITVKVGADGTITGDGRVRFRQSDWGMKPYSAFLGAVKNKDELVLNVHLVAVSK